MRTTTLGLALLTAAAVAAVTRTDAASAADRVGAREPLALLRQGPGHARHPDDPVQGRREFIEHNCYGCHGGLAGGAMGPDLRDAVQKKGAKKVHDTILHGKPHMGMPDWSKHGMTSDEAWIIESYLATLGTPREPKFFIGWKRGGEARQVPPGARSLSGRSQ